jgi:hypothetical protein
MKKFIEKYRVEIRKIILVVVVIILIQIIRNLMK